MADYPRDLIAKSLQLLDWHEATDDTEWRNGQRLFVAVPVRHMRDLDIYDYEYSVINIACGEDQGGEFRNVMCDGNWWSWELDCVAWYVEVR